MEVFRSSWLSSCALSFSSIPLKFLKFRVNVSVESVVLKLLIVLWTVDIHSSVLNSVMPFGHRKSINANAT